MSSQNRVHQVVALAVEDGELMVSKATKFKKDELVAAITLIVQNIDLGALKSLGNLVSQVNDDSTTSLIPASQEPILPESIVMNSSQSKVDQLNRPKLCKSRWKGRKCVKEGCDRAHPAYCSEPSCGGKRSSGCQLWHVKRPENSVKREAAPSVTKSSQKIKITNSQASVKDLKLKLLSSQLVAFKAKEKLARMKRTGTDRSYAEVVSTPQQVTQVRAPLRPAKANQPRRCSLGSDTMESLMELLSAVLASLQATD